MKRLRVSWTGIEWFRECVSDETEDGERWQRWETVFACIKFRLPRRVGEPWFYRWKYDGMPRWNLSLGGTRIMWGFDQDWIQLPLKQEDEIKEILLRRGFKINRESQTSHGSTLFQSFEDGVAAIDVHESGRLTVMKSKDGKQEIYGFASEEREKAIETLLDFREM